MPSVTTLTCPVCGAPLTPNAPRCDYCGSLVFIETDHPRIDPQALNKAVVDNHIARYRQAIRQNPHDETAYYGLGVAYFNLGLLDEAADTLAEAARLMPENPHIQTQLAVVYADLAKVGRVGAERLAWDRLNRALRLRPNLVEALLLKADLQLNGGMWLNAVATWRQAAEADADDTRPPLRRFLQYHAELLELRSQNLKTRTLTMRGSRLKRSAFMTFILTSCIGCTVFSMAESATGVYVISLLAIVAAIVAYWLSRRSLLRPYQVESVVATARNVSSAHAGDVTTLLTSAQAVAANLHRLDDLERQQATAPLP